MKVSSTLAVSLALISLSLPACERTHAEEKEQHQEHQKIVVTSPQAKDVVLTQQYVCQIRSQRNIEVRALQEGYLEPIPVREGQTVSTGDVLFRVVPTLYKAKLDAERAEAQFARVERDNAKRLCDQKVISIQEVALYEAKLAKAEARAEQAAAELNFTVVTARFDGIIDRLYQQQGSLVKKEDLLTTLSDNSVMWVYFNVPEARYLDYKMHQGKSQENGQLKLLDSRIELVLADGSKFDQSAGDTVTIEGKFNNETGNIPFRADFPNPERLLRHGQTGSVLIHQTVHNAIVIPQRATFEVLDKRYVYVVGEDHVVHQRLITIQHEMDDVFIIKSGIGVDEKIILEGGRQVHEGEKVEYEFRKSAEALANQKNHAE
ncbi:efflux RND transporter periplasmic adaptor subunit [Gemmata sp. G18]|uniref:Efflux RND transporter periplasmic adaptor subunit n=1 Tax=Gemmata palustris TaxID=2822762 RepID=A0ABS5BN89_9BACT|nr:efflux RND transporter periplasmic adaptor subunit [Gemmata palustris]MBP3955194.1 efflux RND transporter periplasmic adaptor subunit [Gemmata palustris]